jgi:hypothetical protein
LNWSNPTVSSAACNQRLTVVAGLDPAIDQLCKNFIANKMDARVISAFTRVFDALLPAHDELRHFSRARK